VTTVLSEARPSVTWIRPWRVAWLAALVAVALLMVFQDAMPWVAKYPKGLIVPLRFWVSDFMKWLINDADLGLFTFKEFTRSIAWLLNWFLAAAQGLLAEGFKIPLGGEAFFQIPPLSWVALVLVLSLLAYWAKDRALAALVSLCLLYLVVFGQWDSAMITLSSIIVAVPLGVLGGLLLGILGYRHPWFEKVLRPLLDLMQTVPVFAYLVPVLFLFGFGPVAAMTATMIYAMPPMVRCTMLALRLVPTEVIEFGRMAGCTRRQMTWKVLIPAARPTLR
jgi:glycine betaine/proline transport system permease protein